MSDMAVHCMSERLCTLCEDITSSLEITFDGIYYYLAKGKRTSSYENRSEEAKRDDHHPAQRQASGAGMAEYCHAWHVHVCLLWQSVCV